MSIHRRVYGLLVSYLRRHPGAWNVAKEFDQLPGLVRHTAAQYLPQVIAPQPRHLKIAITSYCNLRCIGCRYGRDFMPNSELPLPLVHELLDDAKEADFEIVRLYGGEPLLHRDLPKMVEHAVKLGLRVYVTTNGLLLKDRMDALYAAGLREVTIGFYGTRADYNAYVQRRESFDRLERSIAYVRDRYGQKVRICMTWLLMRPSCNIAALHQAYEFAVRYNLTMGINLIHYSLPYFNEGADRMLQFQPEDRPAIERVVAQLIRLKVAQPHVIEPNLPFIRSIPDWLVKGPGMRVPCDEYRMIWVGPDGTVQMCYVTFKLGNVHEKRLRDMLFTATHRQAALDAYALNCPNCHCGAPNRIRKDLSSRMTYWRRQSFEDTDRVGSHVDSLTVSRTSSKHPTDFDLSVERGAGNGHGAPRGAHRV